MTDPTQPQALRATIKELSKASDLGIEQAGKDDLEHILPVKTRQASANIAGIETEVVCTAYADRILVIVTQVGKLGCLMQAHVVNPTSSTLQSSLSTMGRRYDVDLDLEEEEKDGRNLIGSTMEANDLDLSNVNLTTLFGTPPPGLADLYPLYAMHIAKSISTTVARESGIAEERPIVVGLALKTGSSRERTSTQAGIEDDEDDLEDVGSGEKMRFDGIMNLITTAKVW